jgi:hypothetical protein
LDAKFRGSSSQVPADQTGKLPRSWDGSLMSALSPAAGMVDEGHPLKPGGACADAPETAGRPTVCMWMPVRMPMNMIFAPPCPQYSQCPVGFYQSRGDETLAPSSSQHVPVGSPFALRTPPGTWNSTPCMVNVSADPPEQGTTLMLQNIPNNFKPDRMMSLLDAKGFAAQYDFVYLPRDFKSRAALGYGFVNFTAGAHALRAFEVFTEFTNWGCSSKKTCQVQWSRTQGFEANVEAVRTSPTMRKNLADNFKPVLLHNGVRISFPARNRADA